jgi:hypothetical protein
MRSFVGMLCLLAILFASCIQSASADIDLGTQLGSNANGYLFSYGSLVQSPGSGETDYYYYYFLQNNSLNHQITSWTWSAGGHSGVVMPSTHDDTFVYGDSSDFPMPSATSSDLGDAPYRAEDFFDASPGAVVNSTITWNDGHQSQCQIGVPSNMVPEPGSLMALTTGLIGILGSWSRKRK